MGYFAGGVFEAGYGGVGEGAGGEERGGGRVKYRMLFEMEVCCYHEHDGDVPVEEACFEVVGRARRENRKRGERGRAKAVGGLAVYFWEG